MHSFQLGPTQAGHILANCETSGRSPSASRRTVAADSFRDLQPNRVCDRARNCPCLTVAGGLAIANANANFDKECAALDLRHLELTRRPIEHQECVFHARERRETPSGHPTSVWFHKSIARGFEAQVRLREQ